ncbi:DUF6809 family protein [Bacillus sp. Hm123]|uniref:DUF6809 family protein n=1 Tax=Bacillus sp. Hm123 TaxID=3450745 RepID=UPI003F440B1A
MLVLEKKRKNCMVTPEKIAKIANETSLNVSLDHTFHFGVACYEEGITEVLRPIAIQDLDHGVQDIPLSRHSAEIAKKVEKAYQELKERLNDSEQQVLKKYVDTCNDLLRVEADDYFIHGFLRGYRYLKNINEYTPGGMR